MKLVTFRINEGLRAGVIVDQYVVDLNKAAAWTNEKESLPTDMTAILTAGTPALEAIKRVVTSIKKDIENAVTSKIAKPLTDVSLFAPVPRPSKIICVGLNYKDHAEETGRPLPEYPLLFPKYVNVVNGPNDPIVLPRVSKEVDFEAELAVVIGRSGRYISEESALDYVAGYTCINDVSTRDYQFHSPQFGLGKSFDTHGPMGPWLVTKDEIPNPHTLGIELKLGDEVMQSSNTKELIFTVEKLISYISEAITLEPGDIIATGTPGGVGLARDPQRFLQPGEVVTVKIEGIGEIANPVIAEKDIK
ncbi:fumarylacetoacetate hydrolase family protein [Oceanobacillus sp. Castelsardo]|uniref:fumarylacetoacetate hydrolase family protein n=1 Tax=Oceanobacillus sp. Castelsardo TaxID=1851204 RepID=UPI000837EFD6|nr:fumarylacetoacetate hydrolase family protein [Oceanobacillus sp. Castelsardo]